MKKIIALATADHHIHKFQAFNVNNSRLYWGLRALQDIFDKARNSRVPILFAGDLIHSPKNIETETNALVQQLFKMNEDIPFIAISGNHDMNERNGGQFKSPSHLDSIITKNFVHLKSSTPWTDYNILVYGIPYHNNDTELKKVIEEFNKYSLKLSKHIKILLLHTDIPGAKTPEGYMVNGSEAIPNDLDKFFKPWDLVLCGHIHKPQKLSKKVYMLGCPIQQNEGNSGQDFGYWEVYSDATMQFISMGGYPKFIRLKKGEEPKDNFNYYIKPDEVLVEDDIELGEFNINNSKSKLATRYCALRQIKSKAKRRALKKILNEE